MTLTHLTRLFLALTLVTAGGIGIGLAGGSEAGNGVADSPTERGGSAGTRGGHHLSGWSVGNGVMGGMSVGGHHAR